MPLLALVASGTRPSVKCATRGAEPMLRGARLRHRLDPTHPMGLPRKRWRGPNRPAEVWASGSGWH